MSLTNYFSFFFSVTAEARQNYQENVHLSKPEEIREKIDFALSAAEVMEKYLLQVTEFSDRPGHGVAQMREEMHFEGWGVQIFDFFLNIGCLEKFSIIFAQ